MAIKSNALAENKAAILAEDGGTIYATLQMRHGKESEMDESKFVPAEIGVGQEIQKSLPLRTIFQIRTITTWKTSPLSVEWSYPGTKVLNN